ncbi:MAG TPA: type 1 glutamine amidotransferase domain-containing protein [Rhodanobacteraceae bacterium]|nr:type 1 glutamine amidotransferase domain-containing protein [Rhodanobacteraceae bacterium]
MSKQLQGKRVAILATDGFEQAELVDPRDSLREAGAKVDVVSPEFGEILGFHHLGKGEAVKVDRFLGDTDPADYDALVVPGGLFNPDKLRTDEKALAFARHFFKAGKPVGAICHGPWVLINAGVVKGRTLTSVPSIRMDLENAGASWRDEAVVVDKGLVTSRTPKDLEAFCNKLIEEFAEGRHPQQHRSAA